MGPAEGDLKGQSISGAVTEFSAPNGTIWEDQRETASPGPSATWLYAQAVQSSVGETRVSPSD